MNEEKRVDFETAFRSRFGVDENTPTEEAFDLIEEALHSPPKFFNVVWGNTGSIQIRSNFDNSVKSQLDLAKRLRQVAEHLSDQAYDNLEEESSEDDV